jgi:hypothetical protein
MFRYTTFWVGIFGLALIALMPGCQFMKRMLWNPNIIPPEVTLNRIEIKKNDQNPGWWFYADDIEPTKGIKGDHGGPLALAFIFNIKNPNKVKVLLDEINFVVKFEAYEMDIIKSNEKTWIPRNTTNQLRVYSLITVQSARLNLLVQAGEKAKDKCEQKTDEKDQKEEKDKENDKDKEDMNWLWCTLEKYWTEIPEFKLPVSVANLKAIFEAKGVTVEVKAKDEFSETPKPVN